MYKRSYFADVARIGVLLVLAGAALLYMDLSNIAVLQSLLVGVFIVGGTHATRRILFPKLDLQQIALQATREANLPAAIIFLAIVLFLIAVMFLSSRAIS